MVRYYYFFIIGYIYLWPTYAIFFRIFQWIFISIVFNFNIWHSELCQIQMSIGANYLFFPIASHFPLSVIPHCHLAFVHHLSFSIILNGLSFLIVCHSTHLPNLRTMDPLSVILNCLSFWIIYHFPLSVISHCLSITSYNLRTIDLVAMETNCNTGFPSN